MEPATMAALGLLIQGGSSIFGAYQQGQQYGSAEDYRRGLANQARGFLQTDPYGYESQIQELLGAPNTGVPTSQAYNTGQDALTQMLRAEPYDLTSHFAALNPIEDRILNEQVADLRGGNTSGLGQRFGSARLNAETDLRQQSVNERQARREQLGFQAYESAQGRRAGAGQALAQLGLGQNQLTAGLEQSRQGFQTNLLQLLAQAVQGRQSNNTNILALMQGMQPEMTANPWASAGGDIGQLLMLWPLLQQMQNEPVTT